MDDGLYLDDDPSAPPNEFDLPPSPSAFGEDMIHFIHCSSCFDRTGVPPPLTDF